MRQRAGLDIEVQDSRCRPALEGPAPRDLILCVATDDRGEHLRLIVEHGAVYEDRVVISVWRESDNSHPILNFNISRY